MIYISLFLALTYWLIALLTHLNPALMAGSERIRKSQDGEKKLRRAARIISRSILYCAAATLLSGIVCHLLDLPMLFVCLIVVLPIILMGSATLRARKVR